MTKKSYEIDMCSGPLLSKILIFSIPLMLSGILQLLFNAADIIVVGHYSGSEALAAVGATSTLINLLVNVFMGLSVGSNVLIAHFYGAHQDKEVSETLHTSILLSILCGFILLIIGFVLAKPLLLMMGTPHDVLSASTLYMQIYFIGMPAMLVYNFGSAILRAIGDTKRPLYFLLAAGVVNVFLNLYFVIGLHMGVAGVALATVLSQCISAGLILLCLMHHPGSCHFEFSKLRLHTNKVGRILRIGLPAGLQGAIFSISNVLIQSSVNSFGSIAMAGNTATANVEGFIYTSMNAFHQTTLSFTSQNLGAKKVDRIGKTLILCLICVALVGTTMGLGCLTFGRQLLGFYSSDPKVIEYGLLRMNIILTTYAACGVMDVLVGSIRGMGYSIMPMLVSLLGACGIRILWIFTIFPLNRTLTTLYLSYPISWTITALIHLICFIWCYKKLKKDCSTVSV
ncbi:MATE family efflux transporter [Sporanaerobium hydrogeniformans]|uniref:MATE family efflux transporter n=1 Tax=Sporanaerobium hydrogeniformans TaxID=3072179 RepID=A0AC61DC42_9FIRM|nr:MATE family efflux transporter [Sporanaerobium hydrogeniformans]PHV70490.1 MATE family efflux transporter [Sporanaerobium hydrogeniformans]